MDADTPKYMIGVAAQLVGMHPQTLRMYENRGLVRPRRTPGGTRLYSDNDLRLLRRITELASGLGLSLQGTEHVLALEERVRELEERCRILERAIADGDRLMRERIEEVHRSYRRDVVLWREPGTEIVVRRQGGGA